MLQGFVKIYWATIKGLVNGFDGKYYQIVYKYGDYENMKLEEVFEFIL